MNWETTRRQMLKGVAFGAGVSLLEPLLGNLAAHAAGGPQAIRKKIVFVVQSNGMNPNHLVPVGVKRRPDGRNERPLNEQLEEKSLKDLTLHEALEPLSPLKNELSLVLGVSGRISLGDHSGNQGALGAYPPNKGALAQTIDSALGDAIPGIIPHVGLGILNRPDQTMNYQISASGPGKITPIQCSPELAFKSLFGSVTGGSSREMFDRKTQLLDFMAQDVSRARSALASEERSKFDQYMVAFESLRDRQSKIDAIEGDLKKHLPKLDERFKKPHEVNRLEAQFETATAALITGLTNVVTLVSGGGGQQYISFPELGIPVDGHHYGHGGGVEGKNYEQCFVTVRQFHTRLIAKMAKSLKSVPEGNGTMWDNTLIVYLSDAGDGHHPNLYEWPVVLIGNLGGKLNTAGRFLQFPTYQAKGHRTMANLFCTLLHAVGKPRDKFGVPDPGLKEIDQTGIIKELLA